MESYCKLEYPWRLSGVCSYASAYVSLGANSCLKLLSVKNILLCCKLKERKRKIS